MISTRISSAWMTRRSVCWPTSHLYEQRCRRIAHIRAQRQHSNRASGRLHACPGVPQPEATAWTRCFTRFIGRSARKKRAGMKRQSNFLRRKSAARWHCSASTIPPLWARCELSWRPVYGFPKTWLWWMWQLLVLRIFCVCLCLRWIRGAKHRERAADLALRIARKKTQTKPKTEYISSRLVVRASSRRVPDSSGKTFLIADLVGKISSSNWHLGTSSRISSFIRCPRRKPCTGNRFRSRSCLKR